VNGQKLDECVFPATVFGSGFPALPVSLGSDLSLERAAR